MGYRRNMISISRREGEALARQRPSPAATVMFLAQDGPSGFKLLHKALLNGACYGAIISRIRAAMASIAKGLVRTAMPGLRCPLPTRAFSA